MSKLSWQQSIGADTTHLVEFVDGLGKQHLVHPSVIEPLNGLLQVAQKDGVSIAIISAFRSFDQQLKIWNAKWQGLRPLYSPDGQTLDPQHLSDNEKYQAIALWSALPGLSRHHWGTDFDIFTMEPLATGYQVQLTEQEFAPGGPCHQLNQWLQQKLEDTGFFRPYREYQQGVGCEPWHISYIETSQAILKEFDKTACRDYLQQSSLQAKDFILQQFERHYQRYFTKICVPLNS